MCEKRKNGVTYVWERRNLICTVEPLGTDTCRLLRTVSNVQTKFPYILLKKTSIIRSLSNTDKGH